MNWDIAKCTDHECPARFDCLRYNIESHMIRCNIRTGEWQSYADFKHNTLFGSCDYFVRLPKKKNR